MFSRNKKVGYGIISVAIILLVIGTIGISFQDEVTDIPTPNTPKVVYFADDPLQENPLALLISAKATITWDRSDIYLVIADGEKKQQCDQITPVELISQSSVVCKAEDAGYEVLGLDNSTGIDWTVENDEYYVGIGTLSNTIPEDLQLNVDYTINLNLSATGYFLIFLIGICGFIFIKYD